MISICLKISKSWNEGHSTSYDIMIHHHHYGAMNLSKTFIFDKCSAAIHSYHNVSFQPLLTEIYERGTIS